MLKKTVQSLKHLAIERTGEERASCFSPHDMEGVWVCYHAQRIAAVQILFFPFFCGGKIYNLVINLFYVPPSPVIGCHWSCVRGKRLHGSFPDFPGDFSPAALSVHGVQTVAPPSAFLNLSPSRHQRVFCPEFSGMSGLHASVLFSCVENMSLRGKPARKIMDYLTFEGKLSCIWAVYSSLWGFRCSLTAPSLVT